MRNFRAHDQAVQARATEAFRRRQWLRKAVRGGGVACVFLAAMVVGTGWWKTREEVKQARPAAAIHGMVTATESKMAEMETVPGENGSGRSAEASGGSLNDEELLAIFPEGSCFIAEVDGKKTLVFHDPEVRAKFFN